MSYEDAALFPLCAQCNDGFATGGLPICGRCNRSNALALAACPTCRAEVTGFDAAGRPRIAHEDGCREHDDFLRKVHALESGQ